MSGLLRYQVFLAYGVLFLALWNAALRATETNDPNDLSSVLAYYAPVWAILLLGVYAVSSIAYGVMTFEDFPDAAAEIERQIKEARAEMTKRGVLRDENEDKAS